jgi:hypothetical protein
VPITTKVVSSNPVHGKLYLIQRYEIEVVWFSHIHKPLFLLMKKVECKIFNSFSSTGKNHAALGIVNNKMLSRNAWRCQIGPKVVNGRRTDGTIAKWKGSLWHTVIHKQYNENWIYLSIKEQVDETRSIVSVLNFLIAHSIVIFIINVIQTKSSLKLTSSKWQRFWLKAYLLWLVDLFFNRQ